MYQCPFFHTHHAPVGAWASLTFGAPGVGMSIDFQDSDIKNSGVLLAGVTSTESSRTIAFLDIPKGDNLALDAEGSSTGIHAKIQKMIKAYGIVPEEEISRCLTPSKDIFTSDNVTFTTYTPYDALPDPREGDIPPISCLPGILMDITVDNTEGALPCTAFFGMELQTAKKSYSFEEGDLVGIRHRNDWVFAAKKSDGVFMTRGIDGFKDLVAPNGELHPSGTAFLGLNVPAGEKKTLTVCWSVYAKEGSNGARCTTYYYNRYWDDLLEGAKAILDCADELRAISDKVDTDLLRTGQDPDRVALFNQAVRSYYASSQLLEDEDGHVRWNICEGAYLWRNTMDLCADHITWELRRNPWIVRCLMEEFIEDYSYVDTVTFPHLPGIYPGGISFTHDMGCYFTYAKHGKSDYERVNDSGKGFYYFMTTEELLNGIYCMAGYVLSSGDTAWLKKHADLLVRLMDSLENRDGPTAEQRNGILKAATTRGGKCALESTTYDALDHSLLDASGNIYVFIKTWCSLLLMKRMCALIGDEDTALRVGAMLDKCRSSSALFRSEEYPWLRANAFRDIPGAVAAAAEPLAVPYMLGVLDDGTDTLLIDLLRDHSIACLQNGVCRDAVSGGLRLSSTSRNTWLSKAVLTIYAMESVLGLSMPEGLVKEVIHWAQISARNLTIGDQIYCDTRQLIGGPYYPRSVTAALWL